jgi:dTMP kinase
VTPDVALKRLSQRHEKQDRLDLEKMDFHKRVYEGYHEVLKMYPDRVKRIDGNQSLEAVTKDCINAILEYLGR